MCCTHLSSATKFRNLVRQCCERITFAQKCQYYCAFYYEKCHLNAFLISIQVLSDNIITGNSDVNLCETLSTEENVCKLYFILL